MKCLFMHAGSARTEKATCAGRSEGSTRLAHPAAGCATPYSHLEDWPFPPKAEQAATSNSEVNSPEK